jgi:tetratricopeptide (TPR) repeat protein
MVPQNSQVTPDSELKPVEELIKEALVKLKKTYELDEDDEILKQRADLSTELGLLYWENKKAADSKKFLNLGLAGYTKLEDYAQIASIHSVMGTMNVQMQNYPDAVANLRLAVDYWKTSPQKSEYLACLQNLGIAYLNMNEEEKATDAIIEGMNITIEMKDEQAFAETLQILLEYYEERKQYDVLIIYKEKALEFWLHMDNKERQFKTLIDLGVLHQIQDEFQDALASFKRAYNVAHKLNDANRMYLAEGFIGESYFKLQDLPGAREAYMRAFMLAIYLKRKNEIEQMRVALLTLGVEEQEIHQKEQEARNSTP